MKKPDSECERAVEREQMSSHLCLKKKKKEEKRRERNGQPELLEFVTERWVGNMAFFFFFLSFFIATLSLLLWQT